MLDDPMHLYVILVAIAAGAAVLARQLRTAPSIVLVLIGIGLALIPGTPSVELDPEVALTIILPPLIYWAGVSMSWQEFRRNMRAVAWMAIGCVVFTTVAVAAIAHGLLGMPWSVGFLLGAIISPPDIVAPAAITRPLGLPRRLVVILEGEGLVNDATALILYKFAVAAVSTGVFSFAEATGTFSAILIGETLYGLAVGWATLTLRHWLRDPRIELTVALVTPYLAFWVPHDLGGSGVIATVAAGLFVSWNGAALISSATRLQGAFFWDLYVYLIEGIVFLVTGLQARTVVERVDGDWGWLAAAAAMLTFAVVAVRFVWVFPVSWLPAWLTGVPREPGRSWRPVFALAFTGVRGVVSLAVAVAIPLTVASGEPFPFRDIILFLSFSVIIATLVGEGLLIPHVVRWLELDAVRQGEQVLERDQELAARFETAEVSLARLSAIGRDGQIAEAVLLRLSHRLTDRREHWTASRDSADDFARSSEIESELIRGERDHLFDLLRRGDITDEARRRLEHELDLDEARLTSHGQGRGL